MKHGKHTHARQNPRHLSSCYFRVLAFLGAFQFSSVFVLCHCPFWGVPIALQCCAHISDKSASAILQWSSTVKQIYGNKHTKIGCQKTAAVHPPCFCDRKVLQATSRICKEVKTGHFRGTNSHESISKTAKATEACWRGVGFHVHGVEVGIQRIHVSFHHSCHLCSKLTESSVVIHDRSRHQPGFYSPQPCLPSALSGQ